MNSPVTDLLRRRYSRFPLQIKKQLRFNLEHGKAMIVLSVEETEITPDSEYIPERDWFCSMCLNETFIYFLLILL